MSNPESASTPQDDRQAEGEETDRESAQILYTLACQTVAKVDELDMNLTADGLAQRSRTELLLDAQLTVLQALYHELRHAHDQAARRDEVIAGLTTALDEQADEISKLRGALADHADSLDRHRYRD